MRNHAADDFTTIRARLDEIEKEKTPHCPQSSTTTLYNCLRSSTKCGPACPYVNDWVGPDKI